MFRILYNKICEFISSALHLLSTPFSSSKPQVMFVIQKQPATRRRALFAKNIKSPSAQPVETSLAFTYSQIRDSHPVYINKIAWHKKHDPPYHEFLVFYAVKDGVKNVGIIERTVKFRDRDALKVIIQHDYTERAARKGETPRDDDIPMNTDLPEDLAEAESDAIDAENDQDDSPETQSVDALSVDSQATTANRVTRGMSSISGSSSLSSSSGASGRDATDRILFGHKESDSFISEHETKRHSKMLQLLVPKEKLTVLELCVLAGVVSMYRPKYTLLEYQCYWYAQMIFDVVTMKLGMKPLDANTAGCGKFSNLPVPAVRIAHRESNRRKYMDMFNEFWNDELELLESERAQRDKPLRDAEARADAQTARADAETARADDEAKERKRLEKEVEAMRKQLNGQS